MLKYDSFIPTIYENSLPIFLLIYSKQKFANLHTCFIWAIERIKAVLRHFHWIF